MSVEAATRSTVLEPGDMLGCYRIQDFLGRGGFGVTYLALDTKLDLHVAIKEYLPEQIAERTLNKAVQPKSSTESSTFTWGLSRFIQEAQTLAKFKHHGIVRVMAVFEQNGTAYMVMEYERGQELKQLIRNRDMCTEANLQKVVGPVIDGLSEVHRHGYIHRDIKPANILIRDDGSPVLLDFGSARLATGAQTQSLTALVSGGYAPLEQYSDNNNSQQGPWTDVYSLGAVLYFAITGKVPVDSTLRGSAVVNDRQDPLTPLVQLAPKEVSISFCQAIDWALSFKIKDRPQSLKQWRLELLKNELPQNERDIDLPSASTRPLRKQELSPNKHTARNQSFEAYRAARRQATGRQFQTLPEHGRLADRRQLSDVNGFDPGEQWDTTRSSAQSRGSSRSRTGSSRRSSRARKSKTLVLVGFSIIALIVVVTALKSQWLPNLQSLVSNESIATPADVIADAQAPAEQAVMPTHDQSKRATTIDEDETQTIHLLEQQQIAAARQRELEKQQQRQAKQADDNARRAAETQKREKEIQAAAVAANQKAAQAAAQAERLARDNASRIATEAARKARRDAQQAAAENSRITEEQAAPTKQATIQESTETRQIASLEKTPSSVQPPIDVTRPITDADIKYVLKQFNYLRMAIAARDTSALQSLAFPSERNGAYLNYVFKTFDSIEVALSGVGATPGDQTVRANLKMISMKRSNGDIVYPPERFKSIPIYSIRSGDWSRIHW